MKQNYVDLEVFNKRNGTTGTVVSQDETTISVKCGDAIKAVTESTFLRWYTIVPQDSTKEHDTVPIPTPQDADQKKNESVKKENPEKKILSAGVPGIGDQLREKFLSLVKDQANQSLDITYNEKSKQDIIKYNGRNVFECTTAKRRFNVMCHPDSLTPDNLKRAERVFPKEWGWSMRARFIFTDLAQWPMMKTIIADGLFYRQREENKDAE